MIKLKNGEIVIDEMCPKRPNDVHCECWYDGDACCACGAKAMTDGQKREQGMIE